MPLDSIGGERFEAVDLLDRVAARLAPVPA